MVFQKTINYTMIQSLYETGLNDYEIADLMLCSQSTVCSWRHREGLPPNDKFHSKFSRLRVQFQKLWIAEVPAGEIARKLRISQSTCTKWSKKLGISRDWGWNRYHRKRREQMERLAKKAWHQFKHQGKSYDEIADDLNMPVQKVQVLIGRVIMNQCREDKACPYKALLPEYVVE